MKVYSPNKSYTGVTLLEPEQPVAETMEEPVPEPVKPAKG